MASTRIKDLYKGLKELEPEVNLDTIDRKRTGVLEVLGPGGDLRCTWDRESPENTVQAKKTFDLLSRMGYAAFPVTETGEQEGRARKWDETAAGYIMVPQIAGGR